jgi:Actin like proteins N terminal domain
MSVMQENQEKVIDVVAVDLGNGFIKSTDDGENVKIEPAVYSPFKNLFQLSSKKINPISVNDGESVLIGQEALESGFPYKSALGESDSRRYYSKEYKDLLFGTIGKHLGESGEVRMLVLGLPNKHFLDPEIKKDLIEMVKGRKIVKIGDAEMVINIQDALVIPQPVGSLIYLQSEGKEFLGRVLVVDGGYGTLDLSEVKQQNVVDYQQKDLGLKQAYKSVASLLERKLGDTEFHINEIPHLLKNGIPVNGRIIHPLEEFPEVGEILNQHFEELYSFVIDCYGSLRKFESVVWTGGVALAHHQRILEKHHLTDSQNSIILTNGQVANAQGFYQYGFGWLHA